MDAPATHLDHDDPVAPKGHVGLLNTPRGIVQSHRNSLMVLPNAKPPVRLRLRQQHHAPPVREPRRRAFGLGAEVERLRSSAPSIPTSQTCRPDGCEIRARIEDVCAGRVELRTASSRARWSAPGHPFAGGPDRAGRSRWARSPRRRRHPHSRHRPATVHWDGVGLRG